MHAHRKNKRGVRLLLSLSLSAVTSVHWIQREINCQPSRGARPPSLPNRGARPPSLVNLTLPNPTCFSLPRNPMLGSNSPEIER